jgi:hypothetical protein
MPRLATAALLAASLPLPAAAQPSGASPDDAGWRHAEWPGVAPARSVLMYVWGGTGREPPFFEGPYLAGLTRVRMLRPADASRGRWLPERVDLAADWRAAFEAEPPQVQETVVGTDVDDTARRVDAAVEAPVLASRG